MPSKPLAELDLATLQKQKSTYTGALAGLVILWLCLIGFIIYVALTRKVNYALIISANTMFITCIPIVIALNKVKAEIKLRKPNL